MWRNHTFRLEYLTFLSSKDLCGWLFCVFLVWQEHPVSGSSRNQPSCWHLIFLNIAAPSSLCSDKMFHLVLHSPPKEFSQADGNRQFLCTSNLWMFILCQNWRTRFYCSIACFLSPKINTKTSFLWLGSERKLILELWVRIRIQRHKIHRNWLLWFAGTSTCFSAMFHAIVLCAYPLPPQIIGPKRDYFYLFFAAESEFMVEIEKNTVFSYIFFNAKITAKRYFLRLEKNFRVMAEFWSWTRIQRPKIYTIWIP